ncbi:MAG: cytochrome d ubiquinol oxidase subunit II [Burkholderiales bacterium]|nr:MAG: cytochrome d ubiquinol oxidase subunit II [Burkholderiales bacterium]TAG82808.1 MAG: cytochrome d ubiquinol oxidase subunit II [Betaproteobacteria bacterium]
METLATVLPLVFMAVMGLAMLAYVVLDGYDLGVGMLLPRAANDAEKDLMVSSIGPFWDANETWLVLGVGILLVAFPFAHGLILTSLYLPVFVMLVGLTLRGVAFDFRGKAGDHRKAFWNAMFTAGSFIASAAQGWMLGSYITSFRSDWWTYAFNLLIAMAVPATYVVLGAGWLIMKAEGDLQVRALRWARQAVIPFAIGIAAISIATPLISETIFNKWFRLPDFFALLPIPLMTVAAVAALWHVSGRKQIVDAGYGWIVFVATLVILLLATLGLAFSIYPYIVIDRLNVWEAASATESLVIILIGTLFTLPAIIGYTIFVYRIFWGKARVLSYGA